MSNIEQPETLHLTHMTYEDVSAALASGFDSVLIPCGAVEQHGPHLPLSMDADHADALAVKIAGMLGRTLIAPTIQVGCSRHHMDFPGTISLQEQTYAALCHDYCTSLAKHGFRRIYLFSAHVGNFNALRTMLPRLRDAVGPATEVFAYTNHEAWLREWRLAVEEAGGDPESVGGHADIAETSLMMHLHPDSVRHGQLVAGHVGFLTTGQLNLMWKNGIASISRNGVLGDARGSSREIGETCLNATARLLALTFAAESSREGG
ncbi:creatininase family protein [Paraburkholderia sp. D15]|uniref:creatininase family protein n=1 Tax=Paraburkholderia sp. D15 TaxID=2880218 RepID=UPI002479CCEB|nr:creatininase family protein [Paraburkholderia sp. D15]WGS52843.1 creatininase family protein [Paraburkholderia sp. D15]